MVRSRSIRLRRAALCAVFLLLAVILCGPGDVLVARRADAIAARGADWAQPTPIAAWRPSPRALTELLSVAVPRSIPYSAPIASADQTVALLTPVSFPTVGFEPLPAVTSTLTEGDAEVDDAFAARAVARFFDLGYEDQNRPSGGFGLTAVATFLPETTSDLAVPTGGLTTTEAGWDVTPEGDPTSIPEGGSFSPNGSGTGTVDAPAAAPTTGTNPSANPPATTAPPVTAPPTTTVPTGWTPFADPTVPTGSPIYQPVAMPIVLPVVVGVIPAPISVASTDTSGLVVPEPASLALVGLGLCGVMARAIRRRRAR